MRASGPWIAVVALFFSAGCGGENVAPAGQQSEPPDETPDKPGDRTPPDAADAAGSTLEWGACDADATTAAPGCACTTNADCDSGWCVQDADGGSVCTTTCVENCPTGWACKGVTNSGSDVTFICIPRWLGLCRPCMSASDCASPDSKCVDYGPEGAFCGTMCLADEGCPPGYECSQGQCKRVGELCGCSEAAIAEGASTRCLVENEHGACEGSRSCGAAGLSACIGDTPEAEACDGADNNCDGQIDEGLNVPGDADAASPAPAADVTAGVCDGALKICAGSAGWVEPDYGALIGYEVEELACDGLDNDCDGAVDEHCSAIVVGHMFGDGGAPNSDDGTHFVRHSIGTPRIVGAATDGTLTVQHRSFVTFGEEQ